MRLTPPRTGTALGLAPSFRAALTSRQAMLDQGWVLYPAATPPTVSETGITFNGALTQYARFPVSCLPDMPYFGGPGVGELTIAVWFTVAFGPSDAVNGTFCYMDDAATATNYTEIFHYSDLTLRLYTGASTFKGFGAPAQYGSYWTAGQRQLLVAPMARTDTTSLLYLNNSCPINSISTVVPGFTPQVLSRLMLGYSPTCGYCTQTIHSLCFWNRKLSNAECTALWNAGL